MAGKVRFGSLFSGIGGMDLGLERAGMQCGWQVEINEFCRKVLTKHWPNVPKFNDVRECGKHNLERVDLIALGFPCQDISVAGDGLGLDGARSGLWFEGRRIVGELRPDYALVENVAALLGRGMGRILADLAALGYDAEWQCLSARQFGALHLRERIFLVAYNRQKRVQRIFKGEIPQFQQFSWCKDVRRVEDLRNRSDLPEPLFRGSCDGIPDWVDRIGSIGNAVVPQVAEWIGKQIIKADLTL